MGPDAAAAQTRWLDRLFADSAAMRLGVTFDSVMPGTSTYPVTTAGFSGVQRGRTQAVTAAAWTVGVEELKPTRNAVHGVFSIEDAARLPGLEDALTGDMRMGLMDAIDKAILLSDTGANENTADITGLNAATGVTEKTITQTNKVKGPETLTAFVELVDGIHSSSPEELNVVAAVGANTLWSTTVINASADNMTLREFLRAGCRG